jgi:phosphate transport system substrate-binding protein
MSRGVRAWLASLAMSLATAGAALAVPPGLQVVFDGNGEGEITFKGADHTGPTMHCSKCHFELFDVSRSSQITRADHRRHVACFACHDGKAAFASRSNCDRCHVEPVVPEAAADAAADATADVAPTP